MRNPPVAAPESTALALAEDNALLVNAHGLVAPENVGDHVSVFLLNCLPRFFLGEQRYDIWLIGALLWLCQHFVIASAKLYANGLLGLTHMPSLRVHSFF